MVTAQSEHLFLLEGKCSRSSQARFEERLFSDPHVCQMGKITGRFHMARKW